MASSILRVFCLAAFAISYVYSLECFECVNVKVISGNPSSITKAQTNPACEAASILSITSLSSRTCRPGFMCAAARGTMTARDKIHGNYASYSVVTRSCLPATELGCSDASDKAPLFLQDSTGHVDVQFKGDFCYCDQDYCSPIACTVGYVGIAGFCLDWWLLPVSILALALAICVVTCCCCCCCCCCFGRQKKTRGVVLTDQPYREFDNKLYDMAETKKRQELKTVCASVLPTKA